MSRPRAPVSVVVVTRDSAGFIDDCLGSLDRLRRPPAKVVVVDNASTDATAERVRAGFPAVDFLVAGANLGFCRANNLGIARTDTEYVLVLNPDTRLEPDFVEVLVEAMVEDASVGIAAGKLLRFDGRTLDSAGQELSRSRQPEDRGYGTRDRGQFDRDATVFGACGAAALYRRAMLEEVADAPGAYFDETLFAFYEDLDLAWRARRRGWRAVYRHRALGYHARGSTAPGAGPPARWAATRRREADARFHIAKNRYLVILRNDRLRDYLRDLPFIFARDAAMLVLLASTSPGVLVRLWRERRVFREALRRRRLDSSRREHQT